MCHKKKNSNEVWTDKHRNVTRKLVVEGGLVQKRIYEYRLVERNDVSRM